MFPMMHEGNFYGPSAGIAFPRTSRHLKLHGPAVDHASYWTAMVSLPADDKDETGVYCQINAYEDAGENEKGEPLFRGVWGDDY